MKTGASRKVSGPRVLAVFVSALLHAVLLALVARQASFKNLIGDVAPTIEVTLLPALEPTVAEHRRRDEIKRNARAPKINRPPLSARVAPPSSAATPPLPVQPHAPTLPLAPGLDSPEDVASRARQALAGSQGCDRPQLTRQQREQCESNRWRLPDAGRMSVNLDPSGRYAKDPTPYLVRRPSRGCRFRATGDVDPMGNDQNARVGITCVKRF